MRKLFLFSDKELLKLAKDFVHKQKGELDHWELEISDCAWPKLHVHYFHMNDGQQMHVGYVELRGPN